MCRPGNIIPMEKMRISLTMDPEVLAAVDGEARAAGMSRSAWLEKVSREAAVRSQFDRFHPPGGVEEFPTEMADLARAARAYWNSADAK